MATLSLQNLSTLVSNMAASVQGAASSLLDLTTGSVLRAILEANASIGLWLQWLLVQVLQMTRLATSAGADVDSFVGDFGLARLPAVAASGTVTLSRYSAGIAALVLPGAQVKTADGTQIFTVIADTSKSAWSASRGGYYLPGGTASATVTVHAATAGLAGNVQAGTITLIASAIAGIDTVTNAAAFVSGVAAESDAALRARFVLYIQSLASATNAAVGYAVVSTQLGLTYTITEMQDPNGSTHLGYFYVVVDDGSGAPSGALLARVGAAVEVVRALGISYSVIAPTLVTANVSMTITTAAGVNRATIVGLVGSALTTYINALPLGAGLPYTRLSQIAYDASPSVTGVSAMILNGGTADIVANARTVIRAGTVAVA